MPADYQSKMNGARARLLIMLIQQLRGDAMTSRGPARRRALLWLSAIVGANCMQISWAQKLGAPVLLFDIGKLATRLADRVYVNAQDLTLLQEFQTPRDTAREIRAQQDMDSAMSELEVQANDARKAQKAGTLATTLAAFVADECTAARGVIATQRSLHVFKEEQAQYPLGNGPRLGLLTELYGKLPGRPNTPQFYLGLLTWARKGYPPIQVKLNTMESAMTPQEVYIRRLQQLINPGEANILEKNLGFAADKEAIKLNEKALMKGQKDDLKTKEP